MKKVNIKAPWKVKYRQISEKGVGSRPQVLNAEGEPLKIHNKQIAELVAAAPEMLRILLDIESDTRLWFLMLAQDHPHMKKPAWYAELSRIAHKFRAVAT